MRYAPLLTAVFMRLALATAGDEQYPGTRDRM
jgi:hypothetical protein